MRVLKVTYKLVEQFYIHILVTQYIFIIINKDLLHTLGGLNGYSGVK